MRIAVLMTIGHFIQGGGEKMADDLVHNLQEYGHAARRYDTMYSGTRLRHFIRGQHCTSMMRFDDVDLVIPLVLPNCNIRHPRVVPWLIGQSKVIYQFFDDEVIGIGQFGSEGRLIRDLSIAAESSTLHSLPSVYTISPRVKELLLECNHVYAEVLPLPIEKDGGFFCREYGDFLLYHSRIDTQKRQHLAIEAMRHTKTPVKLIIAGTDTSSGGYIERLQNYIADHHLMDRVKLLVGYFSDEQKREWLSTCLGGFYLGENEDYWAIVTTEVMLSKKPVIAPIDTGATKYVVKDGITGLQPEGTPKAIAEAMDRLYLNRAEAKCMGEAGYEWINKVTPSWETVVHTLTAGV